MSDDKKVMLPKEQPIGAEVYIVTDEWDENHWVLSEEQFKRMEETRDFKNGEIVYKAQVYRKY